MYTLSMHVVTVLWPYVCRSLTGVWAGLHADHVVMLVLTNFGHVSRRSLREAVRGDGKAEPTILSACDYQFGQLVVTHLGHVPAEALEKASEERAGLIASRAGEVLGAHTILKEDHFPGCQSGKLPNIVPGAPNFRGVPGQNVYGSALPTVDGIKEVLQHVGAASNSRDKRQVCPSTACRCTGV